MYKDITASLVAATRKVVEASSAKAANEAAQKEQYSNLSKSMRPAYEGSAPRNAQEITLLKEKAPHTIPKTPNEKKLAALADDGKKNVITHADVMVGRGVKKEEMSSKEKMKKGLYNKEEAEQVDETIVNGKIVNNKIYVPGKSDAAFDYKKPRRPQDTPNRKSGDVTSTGHDVKKISTGTVYTKRFEENEVEAETIAEAPVDGVAPGSMEGDKHMCASKVMHKEWKEGKTLFSQHAEPNEIGLIEWYDVMFDHGIEKHVPTRDLEIMVSESHMSHSKKKKM